MTEDVLQPLGVRVSGLDLRDSTPATAAPLRRLLADHGVVVFSDQAIDDDTFLRFLRSFGALMPSVGETPVPSHPDLNVISNVGRLTPPRSTFHVDTTYVSRPPAYTALRAVTIPAAGGETLFTDQYRAYDTLPTETRDHLAGRTMEHVVTGVELGPDDQHSARHPLFRRHPLTGRTALYLTTAARCTDISGLDAAETAETVSRLLVHSTQEENTYRHRWHAGDVVMWDNGCVLHRADHSGVSGDRVMHRGMVADYGPDALDLAS